MSLRTKPALGLSIAIIAVLLLPIIATAQALLDPVQQPKFLNPLPIAARIDATAGGYLEIEARQAADDHRVGL
jgi:hypothetical protein